MYCMNCGKEIPNDSKVCGYCGSSVESAASAGYDANAGQQVNAQQPVYTQQVSAQQPVYTQPMSTQQPVYAQPAGGQQPVYGQAANGQQPVYGQAANGQQPVYGQAVNGQQPVYGQAVNGQQPVYGQPGYVAAGGTSAGYEPFKPDYKFNFAAFFFTSLWLLIKGMWEAFAITFGIGIVAGILCLIPVLGWIIAAVVSVAIGIFWGRNGNYYYRLKKQQGISFIKAIQNPNLRRI